MGINEKIARGQVQGGTGVVKGAGVTPPQSRAPSMPVIGPKRECDIVNGNRGNKSSGGSRGGKGY